LKFRIGEKGLREERGEGREREEGLKMKKIRKNGNHNNNGIFFN